MYHAAWRMRLHPEWGGPMYKWAFVFQAAIRVWMQIVYTTYTVQWLLILDWSYVTWLLSGIFRFLLEIGRLTDVWDVLRLNRTLETEPNWTLPPPPHLCDINSFGSGFLHGTHEADEYGGHHEKHDQCDHYTDGQCCQDSQVAVIGSTHRLGKLSLFHHKFTVFSLSCCVTALAMATGFDLASLAGSSQSISVTLY